VVRVQRDSDGSTELNRGSMDVKRVLQHVQHSLGYMAGAVTACAWNQQRELSPAKRPYGVLARDRCAQAFFHFAQQLLACAAPKRLVHVLESVQVGHQHGYPRLIRGRPS